MCLTADLYLLFLTLLTVVCLLTRLTLLIADVVFGMNEGLYMPVISWSTYYFDIFYKKKVDLFEILILLIIRYN